MPPITRGLGFVALLAGAAGCQHIPPPTPPVVAAVRFVDPPPPPAREGNYQMKAAPATTRLLPAEAIPPLALPIYPKTIPAKERPAVALVGLKIVIDTAGRVASSGPSLYVFSTPGPHAAEFQAAAEAALAQWRFKPAQLFQVKPAAGRRGEEGYVNVTDEETIEWNFDVVFSFNAAGDVTTATPK